MWNSLPDEFFSVQLPATKILLYQQLFPNIAIDQFTFSLSRCDTPLDLGIIDNRPIC